MVMAENLAPILESLVRLAWPCMVGWALWYYRYEVSALLRKLERLKLPGGGEAYFEAETSDELSQKRTDEGGEALVAVGQGEAMVAVGEGEIMVAVEAVRRPGVKWGRPANLFWLGYDLATGVDRLGFGAPSEGITHSLRQSWWHAKELGFTESSIVGRLETLKESAKEVEEPQWDMGRRDRYIRELYRVVSEIERLAIEQQPGFDPVAKE
jgi:hypothetical protein